MSQVVLQRGDQLPDFEAPTIEGSVFRYADIWQQRNLLVLNTTVASPAVLAYVDDLRTRIAALTPDNSTVAAVQNASALPASSVIIGDRWGEIVFVAPMAEDVSHWPAPDDLLEWLNMVRCRC
jgi:hypothetical protein